MQYTHTRHTHTALTYRTELFMDICRNEMKIFCFCCSCFCPVSGPGPGPEPGLAYACESSKLRQTAFCVVHTMQSGRLAMVGSLPVLFKAVFNEFQGRQEGNISFFSRMTNEKYYTEIHVASDL